MYYQVAKASEFLVVTGVGINDIKITKKAWIWPFQRCRIIDVTPVNYTFEVNAMRPAVFTIGPRVENKESLVKYAKLLSDHARDSAEVKELVQGVIEGETRVLAASMTMEEIFKGTKDFKQQVFDKVQLDLDQFGLLIYNSNIKQLVDVRGHEYFSYLGQKVQMEAANQAKIDVAEARMKGEIGAKQKGLTLQNAAKIDAETDNSNPKGRRGTKEQIKVQTDVRIYENQKAADVAEANSLLETQKATWQKQAEMAKVEAQKATAIREAELQQQVETKNALTKVEKLKAEHLSKATVEYEIKVQEANAELYKKQKEAEAVLYEKEKAAEAQRIAAKADLFAKRKEAEGLMALAEAKGNYVRTLLTALGGDYNALRDFMMIDGGLFKDLAATNAKALKGLQPKISIWTNGSGEGVEGGAGSAAVKDLASVYKTLPPLFHTINEQTGMQPPSWLGSLTTTASTSNGTLTVC